MVNSEIFWLKKGQLQRRKKEDDMITINKKFVVDEKGNPKEVIILWEDFKKIEKMLGLDLDSNTIDNLKQARKDREAGNKNAYVELDSI
jgi:hypothetical protein